jgi:hypothetical protein
MKTILNNNKTNMIVIIVFLLSLLYLIKDFNNTPTTGSWVFIILGEMSLQILYNNLKEL